MDENGLQELEERVAHLEDELRQIRSLLPQCPEKLGWQAIVGSHEGDEVFAAIARRRRKNSAR